MRNLLAFLSRYRFFFLFLILEAISIIRVYQNDHYQHTRIFKSTNLFTGTIVQTYDNITSYLSLKKANEELAKENALLRNQLTKDTSYIRDLQGFPVPDSNISYISAKVISNSVNKRNNYFMVNKGTDDGVQKDMGVINYDGVVGIITNVSKHFSSGMSILHKSSRISARIRKNNHMVSISWPGINYRTGLIEDIPKHVDVEKGDTIVTSGNSDIFPEGIMLGVVGKIYEEDNQLFKTATIRFSVDYNNIYWVYIIDNHSKQEKLNLNELSE